MFGWKNVAALESAAQEVHVVTTRANPADAVKTVIRVWEGRMTASAVFGALLNAIAAGSQDHRTQVSLPGDSSWAVLRLHVLSDQAQAGTREQ